MLNTLPKFLQKACLASLFSLSLFFAKATHISGGDMDVQWITGNDYRVTLKLFSDCANATWSGFDNSVTITVRENGTNSVVSFFNMSLKNVTRLTLGDECFTPPSSVCMDEGFYSNTVTLPNNANGYYFVWERCCRSPINLNLIRDQAMVFYAKIPSPSLRNSSPKFGTYPTNGYMCINETNYFNFDVSDADGDELRFSLITPLAGSATSINLPYITDQNNPGGIYPFAPVNWQNPYNLNNIVGGTPNMSIDPETGIITCKPVTQGAFTFAILVEEFRNGVKLGEIVRDIQFFAINCEKQVASINQTPIDDDTALEGCIKASFKFELSKSLTRDTTVCFDIKGSATNGVDYAFIENCITIPAGQTFATIIIDAFADGLDEGLEDIFLIYNPIPCVDFVKDTVFLYINDPLPIDYSLEGINLTCNQNFSGQIDAEISGGYPPYIITITPNGGVPTDYTDADLPLTGLPAGTYLVEIDDIYGCAGAAEVTGAIYDTGPTFLPDGNGNVYTTTLSVTGMSGTTVASPDDIVSVCLNMEHSFLGDLEMRLIAPNGTELILKQRFNSNDGNTCDLGEPVARSPKDGSYSSNTTPGIGYDYCFNATPTYLTMVQESKNYTRTHTDILGNSYNDNYLPAGSYTPYEPFDNLIGAPLNGDWTIWVRDHLPQDNGWIFNWSISFRSGGAGDIITLTEPAPINIALNGTVTKASCNGNDGAIDINVNGAFGPFTYFWSNGATTQDITGIAAGNYTVTVTDSKGCSKTASFDVSNATGPTITANIQDELCYQSNDGAIDASFTGTITNVSWSNGETSEDISGLAPGNYSVSVTDNIGCVSVETFTVNSATQLYITGDVINERCGDREGEIYISVVGGNGNYTYLWSNGRTTQNITDLQQGTYTVTVSDGNGCSLQKSFSVINTVGNCTPNCTLTINSANIVSENCGNGSGSITLSVYTSTPPHNVLWSDGSTGDVISGLVAGSYTATVTDSQGCEVTETFTVTNNSGTLAITNPILVDETCGSSNGSISITATGGNGSYTYLWSNGGTTNSITNIKEGTYSVTLTDGLGCSTTSSFTIINDAGNLAIELVNLSDAICSSNNGFINIRMNPSESYTFNWSNGATTEDIGSLSDGTYTVTATNTSTGCKLSETFTVGRSSGTLAFTIDDLDDETCGNSNGDIELLITGGNGVYSVLWNTGATTQNLNNIPAGTYSANITDGNGCQISTGDIIVNNTPGTLSVTPFITNENCGDSQGAITLVVSGGTPGYSYSWSNGATTKDISGLSSGSYTYTVTDQAGCIFSTSVLIENNPGSLTINTVSITDVLCGESNGSINIDVTGGNGVYTYNWSNGATSQDITNITNGSYTITVNDGAGCTASENIEVKGTLALGSANITDDLCGQGTGAISINVNGGSALQYTWSNSATTKDVINLINGNYTVNVTSFEGCTLSESFSVNNDPACNRMCIDSYSDAPSGTLYDSGGANGNYGNNENCGFLIEPFCAESITISFDWFRTETNVDFLIIYEGTDNTGIQRLRASGNTNQPTFTVNAPAVYIQFLSDVSTVYSGFILNWTSNATTNMPVANFNISNSTPFVNEDVSFTSTSTDAFEWSWDIDGDGIEDYNTENITHAFTAAGVYDVTLTVTNCNGSHSITRQVNVTGRPIIFINPLLNLGFINSCGESLIRTFTITNSGTEDLIWETSNANFTTSPSNGVLASGDSQIVTVTITPYNNNGIYTEIFVINSNDPVNPTLTYTITTNQSVDCFGLFCFSTGSNLSSGQITDSGGETGIYNNNEDCEYLISPVCVGDITLSFSAFDVSDLGDTLYIYDGINTSGILLLKATGNVLPANVTASSGNMFIHFISDGSITAPGFVANWTSTISPSAPVASFSISNSEPKINQEIQFTNTSTNSTTSWEWSFGDGNTSIIPNPTHTYATAECFDVTLSVSDDEGCEASTTQEICVTNEEQEDDEDEPLEFAVFPNPTSGIVYINLASKEFEFIVYNTIGELVNYGLNKINDYQYVVDFSQLSNGVYYIRVNAQPFKIVKID
jgi:PKD repeat protein/subtilisin-like proprotein convertase family protein